MTRLSTLAIALGTLAALGYGLVFRDSGSRAATHPQTASDDMGAEADTRAQIAGLSHRLASLEHEVASLHQAARSAPVSVDGTPKAATDPSALDDVARNAPPAEDQLQAWIERLETQVVEEPRDARWNAATEVRSKLAAVLPAGSQVRDLVCQSSLCRLETVHADMTAYQSFLARGFGKQDDPNLVWSGSTTFAIQDEESQNGRIVAVAFLHKPEAR